MLKLNPAKPRIFIPVFPGTNCELDAEKAFIAAGGEPELMVFRNLSPEDIEASINRMVEGISRCQILMFPGGFSAGDEPDGSGKFIATSLRNPRVAEAVTDLLENRDGLILGICNGFQALIKVGLVPYGKIVDITQNDPTLTFNTLGRHVSRMAYTRVISKKSPWHAVFEVGEVHCVPISHGEGRFSGRDGDRILAELAKNGQIATQYCDNHAVPAGEIAWNPNGSIGAVEGIFSPDGRVFGKMGHSERVGKNLLKNVPGSGDQKIFEAGVGYFK